jgi:DNA anti-recombination protein RmuC
MRARGAILSLVVVACVFLGIASCAKPPDDQARRARGALADLRDVGKGEKWAPDAFAAAADALQSADRELSAQHARFFLTRDYAKAAELYTRVIEDVEMAREAVRSNKAASEKRAREALEAASAAINHAQAALTIAPVSRDSRASFDLLNQQLDRMEQRLAEVRNLIVAEDYQQATDRAEAILAQVTSMLRSVSVSARH